MFKKMLVPLDGSKSAERAIPVAACIAHATGGSIVFVHVVLPPVEFGTYTVNRTVSLKPGAFEARFVKVSGYLEDVVTAYADDLVGIDVEIEAVSGAASPAIFSVARFEQVDLVIMCSHEESGLKRWLFGSVAHEAVRHSPVPVLVLTDSGLLPIASEMTRPVSILVPLDGSKLSETALEPAAQLASVLAAPASGALHLLRVVDLPSVIGKLRNPEFDVEIRKEARQEAEVYVKEVIEHLQKRLADVKVTITSSVVVSPDIAGRIIEQAEQSNCDLIAVTTHGRSGLRRLLMGSVTEHILGVTRLPLLIVRSHEAEVQHEPEIEKDTVERRGHRPSAAVLQ